MATRGLSHRSGNSTVCLAVSAVATTPPCLENLAPQALYDSEAFVFLLSVHRSRIIQARRDPGRNHWHSSLPLTSERHYSDLLVQDVARRRGFSQAGTGWREVPPSRVTFHLTGGRPSPPSTPPAARHDRADGRWSLAHPWRDLPTMRAFYRSEAQSAGGSPGRRRTNLGTGRGASTHRSDEGAAGVRAPAYPCSCVRASTIALHVVVPEAERLLC